MAVGTVDDVAVHQRGAPVSPATGRRIHLAMLAVWVIIGLPVSYVLRDSVAWVVALSVYAIVVGHWSGWSAERPSEVVES